MISGKKTGGRCGTWLPYARIAELEVVEERTGKSRSRLIALCVEKAIREIAKEERVQLPSQKGLPSDRHSYLVSKGLGLE